MNKKIRKILMLELGTIVYAIAVGMFILPGKILSGGVAGITTLISRFITIDSDVLAIVLTTALFIMGVIFLGKDFTVNTLVYSISYPFALLFVTRCLPSYEVEPLLAAIYGGAIGGFGLAIIFRNGGSSGGTDVVALLLEKYFHLEISKGIMLFDAITVSLGLLVYGLNAVLVGLICVFITTQALNYGLHAYTGIEARKIEIISDRYQEISDEIHKVLDRGTTLYDIEGGYTRDKKKMLMVVVAEEQYDDIKSIIDKFDPNAFVIVSGTKDVHGEGFTFAPRI